MLHGIVHAREEAGPKEYEGDEDMFEIDIQVAETDAQIQSCFPVMHELRPHIGEDEFLPRVRAQMASGYRLGYAVSDGVVVAVAGFRVGENLAWGRFLYVDDLVTSQAQRSKGYGANLLSWLAARGLAEGCVQMHLDSGAQRLDAHRFYEREGMAKTGYHFVMNLQVDVDEMT